MVWLFSASQYKEWHNLARGEIKLKFVQPLCMYIASRILKACKDMHFIVLSIKFIAKKSKPYFFIQNKRLDVADGI